MTPSFEDENALTQLVQLELPKVYNLSLKLCQNRLDAEDLCQEVLTRAILSIKNFRGESSRSTWIYQITLNAWKNKIRYEKRRHTKSHVSLSSQTADGEMLSELDLPESHPTPEKTFELRESREHILRALDQLDADDKAIVILKDVQANSYEEISVIMGINLGTVKPRLSRARERLREIFETLGEMRR